MRYLLVDRFLELEVGRRAVALKCVTRGERFWRHLDAYPATLVLEALFQTAGQLTRAAAGFERSSMLGKLEFAEFPSEARAGDTMKLVIDVLRARPEGNFCEGVATVGDRVVGRARFLILFMPPDREPAPTADVLDRRRRFLQAVGLEKREPS
jgi:3-hydroxyacyl-[acyl-carrier-protein] dehydratase